jgi:hypothetical protein
MVVMGKKENGCVYFKATSLYLPANIERKIYMINVKFTLEHAMKAQRGSTGIALLFL